MKFKRISLLYSRDMWSRIYFIAHKEFKTKVRSGWILALIAVFVSMSLLVTFYGASLEEGLHWHHLEEAVMYMVGYMEFMAPILGIIFGYGSIVQERESGTLELMSSYPLDRGEIIAGKFLGLWGIIALSVGLGLGAGGVILSTQVERMIWSEYYLFIFSSILLGGVFLSFSMMLSTVFRTSNSSMCGSIFILFLYNILWLFIMYTIAELSFGWDTMVEGISPPTWYFVMQLFNPVIIWYTLLTLNIPALRLRAMELGGTEGTVYPDIYQTWSMIILLIVWIAIPLLISEYMIRRSDVC